MQTDLFIIPAAVQSFLASARFFEINLFNSGSNMGMVFLLERPRKVDQYALAL